MQVEKFVSYDIASKLKELGFNEECLGAYTYQDIGYLIVNMKTVFKIGEYMYQTKITTLSPLWQQAIRWIFDRLDYYYPYLKLEIFSDGSGGWRDKDEGFELSFNNIEEAVLLGIKEIEKQINK